MTLPDIPKVTKFEDSQVTNLNEALDHIGRHAISIQYGTATPTMLNFGVLYIKDDGTNRAVYLKTGKGNIIAL